MSTIAERLLKRKTRIAEAMQGDNYIPETLDAGEQAIAEFLGELELENITLRELINKHMRGL